MPSKRIFLGWERPALHSAVDILMQERRDGFFVDFSNLIIVVPGQAAGRRLLELLVQAAGGHMIPPQIVTQGQLPELLYAPQKPFASDLVQRLAWAQAVKLTPPNVLAHLVTVAPDQADWQGWIRLGNLLRRQHLELAGDMLNFADVARVGSELEGFNETNRWLALSTVQGKYWQILDELELWDQQTARVIAIEKRECHTPKQIVTIGTVDLNRTIVAMLDQVSDQVLTLIDAPESLSERFDELGGLVISQWVDSHIELTPEQLVMCEDGSDQINVILETLKNLNGRYSLEEIHIGVPDTNLVPQLQRSLTAEKVPTHWPVDRPIQSQSPYMLLMAACDFIESKDRNSFSSLIRHPDFSEWISESIRDQNWLSAWDQFVAQYLPLNVDWFPTESDDRSTHVAATLVRTVSNSLAHISEPKVMLSRAGSHVRNFFQEVYGKRRIQPHNPDDLRLRDVIKKVLQAFDSHSTIPAELDVELTVVEAIRLTLSMIQSEMYRPQLEPAIQLSGWLEMPLDDTPVAIVTTFNEGYVPDSLNHDLFLPNRLRVHLGVEDNHRRFARDLYNLTTMLATRDVCRILVSRRDALNEHLNPSRLIFATDDEEIPARVLSFYQQQGQAAKRLPKDVERSRFMIPRPENQLALKNSFRVTELRDYLASPYRYYLRHILKLVSCSDSVEELDGAAFGLLLHDVLQKFGQSEIKDSTSVPEITEFLRHELDLTIQESYGNQPLATVLIQKEQAQQRLNAFADWQAEWRREGWSIRYVERNSDAPEPFDLLDGRSVYLRGRIDRIDYHAQSNRWTLFDYKTGDRGAPPEKTHRSKGVWTDLQLPLYLHLAKEFHVEGDVQLGYIVLPRDTGYVQGLFADWTPGDIEEAYEVARAVIREILEQKFWKPLSTPVASMNEFDAICQVGVFGQEAIL